jgi:hypothetical protein
MMGERRDTLAVAGPGEIVAVVGLQQTYTGNTLCDTQHPVTLGDIHFPDPVIAQAIIPDRSTDELLPSVPDGHAWCVERAHLVHSWQEPAAVARAVRLGNGLGSGRFPLVIG